MLENSETFTMDKNNTVETLNIHQGENETSLDQNIIRKILNNSILKEAIDNYNEPGVINLINPEWEKILQNNVIYQKHKENSVKYCKLTKNQPESKNYLTKLSIINKEECFEILVVGYFKVANENSVIVSTYCKPIIEIGKVMCTQIFLQNCKFFMQSCGGICPSCRELDLPLDNNWCIKDTKVYTPKGIINATRSYVKTIFQNPNLGIARLSITMKYYFGSNSKIGGTVRSMIFIQENLLHSEEAIKEILTIDTDHFIPNHLVKCEENVMKKETVEDEKRNYLKNESVQENHGYLQKEVIEEEKREFVEEENKDY